MTGRNLCTVKFFSTSSDFSPLTWRKKRKIQWKNYKHKIRTARHLRGLISDRFGAGGNLYGWPHGWCDSFSLHCGKPTIAHYAERLRRRTRRRLMTRLISTHLWVVRRSRWQVNFTTRRLAIILQLKATAEFSISTDQQTWAIQSSPTALPAAIVLGLAARSMRHTAWLNKI